MSFQNLSSYQRLPDYLKSYVVSQNYQNYTPRDHATWRYIMRNAREFFKEHAHEVYLNGLKKTGIPIDKIPEVETMDRVLSEFGWGALCVCGFIPPLAFLEFQSRKILPIAADMRSLEHIAYTPAPDIVHEAAGHAPIIADQDYSDYLTRYAHLAKNAIFSHQDVKLYEAIRLLSDVKENPDSKPEEIEKAEAELEKAVTSMGWVSEAARVARMNWWTAEYGLVGDLDQPRIYGAGLLSSLGEGQSCLENDVKKIPLSLDCIHQSYDITRPQPQLFVARDFAHLVEVLEELEDTMSYKIGGIHGLETARTSQAMTSTVVDTGVAVSGILDDFETDNDQVSFIRWSGPVQLSYESVEIKGHGSERHPGGFSSPVGAWKACPVLNPADLNQDQLRQMNLVLGQKTHIETEAGFLVEGVLSRLEFIGGKLSLLTWKDCTVKKGDQIYFDPAWGEFDMLVGVSVPSVFGGPADPEHFTEFDFGKASTSPGRQSPFTAKERSLFDLYQRIRDCRNSTLDENGVIDAVKSMSQELCQDFPQEWLPGIELVELLHLKTSVKEEDQLPWLSQLKETVLSLNGKDSMTVRFIQNGLARAGVPD